jgi:hypothetical protein
LDHEDEQKKVRGGRSEEDLRAGGGESLVVHSCFGVLCLLKPQKNLHNDCDRDRQETRVRSAANWPKQMRGVMEPFGRIIWSVTTRCERRHGSREAHEIPKTGP